LRIQRRQLFREFKRIVKIDVLETKILAPGVLVRFNDVARPAA
jgi:hypothetical protein